VKAPEMAVATLLIAVVAPSAMIAATRAYSIRSCPDSSRMNPVRRFLGLFMNSNFIIAILLLAVKAIEILVSKEMLEAAGGNVNYLIVLAQRE
jgi:hypothetical protein